MCMHVSAMYHNAQWYWSDKLCKLITDQWWASLGARDSESCWFTEEIGTYMRCWEIPGDLPLVIYLFVSFRSFHWLHSRKDLKFISLVEDHPVFPKNVYKNLLISFLLCLFKMFPIFLLHARHFLLLQIFTLTQANSKYLASWTQVSSMFHAYYLWTLFQPYLF
jgi:hypothetical protein